MSEAVREVPKKERPEFRNIHITDLSNYRLPPAGWVSILHRVSGAGMFLLLPFLLYLFELSLRSELSFAYFAGIVSHPLVKLILLGLIWAYLQHFCAGVRHLYMDFTHSVSKEFGRVSALVAMGVAVLLTIAFGVKLFMTY